MQPIAAKKSEKRRRPETGVVAVKKPKQTTSIDIRELDAHVPVLSNEIWTACVGLHLETVAGEDGRNEEQATMSYLETMGFFKGNSIRLRFAGAIEEALDHFLAVDDVARIVTAYFEPPEGHPITDELCEIQDGDLDGNSFSTVTCVPSLPSMALFPTVPDIEQVIYQNVRAFHIRQQLDPNWFTACLATRGSCAAVVAALRKGEMTPMDDETLIFTMRQIARHYGERAVAACLYLALPYFESTHEAHTQPWIEAQQRWIEAQQRRQVLRVSAHSIVRMLAVVGEVLGKSDKRCTHQFCCCKRIWKAE